MRLEEIATPVGPEPVVVYWRRRLVAIGLLIVLLFVVSRCAGGGGKKKNTGSTKGTVTTSPSASPKATTPTASSVPCQTSDLTVSADADGADYGPGATPKIAITIKNVSGHACMLDTSKRFLTISSGGDLWWSSAACPSGAQPAVSLSAQQQVKSSYTWDRRRLRTGCTPGDLAPAGTYLAQAHLDSIVTPGAVLRLRTTP